MNEAAQQRRIQELNEEIKYLKENQTDLIETLGFAVVFLLETPKFKGKSPREIIDWLADNARKTS